MYKIDELPALISVGNLGEGESRTLEFDVTPWLEEFPGGLMGISYIRPGEGKIWPACGVERAGNILRWTIGDHALAKSGTGTAVIRLTLDRAKVRSGLVRMTINPGHENAGEAPDGMADYVGQLIELGADVKEDLTLVEGARDETVEARDEAVLAKDAAIGAQESAEAASRNACECAGSALLSAQQAQAAADKIDGTELEVNVNNGMLELWLIGKVQDIDIEMNGNYLEVYAV